MNLVLPQYRQRMTMATSVRATAVLPGASTTRAARVAGDLGMPTWAAERAARAVGEYVPRYTSRLGPTDAARAERLIGAVLADHPPRIVVQRTAFEAVQLLEGAAPRLRTIWDGPVPGYAEDTRGDSYRDARLGTEQKLDLFGAGQESGRTVYGSIELDGLLERSAEEMYGSVRFLVGNPALQRTVLTHQDSMGLANRDVAPVSRIASVLLDSIPPAELEAAVSSADDSRARELLQRALADREKWQYVEAQVLGGVSLQDVAAVTVNPHGPIAGVDGAASMLERLRTVAAERRVPFAVTA